MTTRDALDLLTRARRQPLPAREEQELAELLKKDAAARWLFQAGLQAERESAPSSEDAAWITRMARSVELAALDDTANPRLSRERQRPSARRLTRVIRAAPALAASICFACGALAGVGTLVALRAVTPAAAPDRAAIAVDRRRPTAPPQAAAAPIAAPADSSGVTMNPVAPPAAQERRSTPRRALERTRVAEAPPQTLALSAAPAAPSASTAPLDAAELYRRANRARQEGRQADAIAAYLELQSRQPQSAEAIASHLTLGNLYLLQGEAELALAQFRRHQAQGGAGFGRESLWGAALALHELGRNAEERATLTELVTRYPNSAYESAAQRRLQQAAE